MKEVAAVVAKEVNGLFCVRGGGCGGRREGEEGGRTAIARVCLSTPPQVTYRPTDPRTNPSTS